MITCAECIERFKAWGDDPRIKSGRYRLSGCDYCNKPQYYRELEAEQREPQVTEIIHRHADMSKQEFADLQSLKGQVKFLQSKIEELTKRRKPEKKQTDYKGLSI